MYSNYEKTETFWRNLFFFSLHTTQQQIKGFIANLSQKYINPEL